MAIGSTQITVVGNLSADPELRFTPQGRPVANFTVCATEKKFNKEAKQWEDGDTLFMRCNIWGDYAENCAESLQKGMRVIVVGDLKSRQYETKDGEKRTVWELEASEVAPALRYATAQVTRSQRKDGQQQQGQQRGAQQQGNQQRQQDNRWGGGARPDQNPWGGPAQAPQGSGGGWGQQEPAWGNDSGQPPF